MKKKFIKLLLAFFLSSFPICSFAAPELGIIIGSPTGFSIAYNQFQGALGWDLDKYLHAHVDYLFYKTKINILELYVGGGGLIVLENSDKKDKAQVLGARLPVGVDYLISDVKLRVFFELVPTLFFIKETSFGLQWGLGVRYVF